MLVREGYKQTEVGVIPEDWQMATLKEYVAEFIVPMRDKPKIFRGNIPWCRIEDFDGKYLSDSKSGQYVDEKIISNMNLKVHPKGTVLCSCSATLGICAIAKNPLITNQTFIGLNPKKEKCDSNFLYYLISSNAKRLQSLSTGTTIAYLPRKKFENLKCAFPSLPEQQKIAAILTSVDNKIEVIDEQIAKTERLKKGLMQKLLSEGIGHTEFKDSEIGRIPKEWEAIRLGDIGKVSMCKRIMKKQTTQHGEIPFYKIGTFGKEPDAFIPRELYEEYKSKYSFPKKGDILISASGTIGRTVVYDNEPAYFQDSNIVWIDNPENKILNSFLYYIYKTVKWQTDGNTIARLYNDNIRRIKISVPPLTEQKQIARILSTTDDKLDTLRAKKEKYETLKKGLMQKLLTGEVRVKV